MEPLRLQCPGCKITLKLSKTPSKKTEIPCPKCQTPVPLPLPTKPGAETIAAGNETSIVMPKRQPASTGNTTKLTIPKPPAAPEAPKAVVAAPPPPAEKPKEQASADGEKKKKKKKKAKESASFPWLWVILPVLVVAIGLGLFFLLKRGPTLAQTVTADFLPPQWQMASRFRLAAILNSPLLAKMPPAQRAEMDKQFKQVEQQHGLSPKALEVITVLKTADHLLMLTELNQPAPQHGKPENVVEKHKGVTIYKEASSSLSQVGGLGAKGNEPFFSILAHPQLVVSASTLPALKAAIDRAFDKQGVPIDFPANMQISIKAKELQQLINEGLAAQKAQLASLPIPGIDTAAVNVQNGELSLQLTDAINLNVGIQFDSDEKAKEVQDLITQQVGQLKGFLMLMGDADGSGVTINANAAGKQLTLQASVSAAMIDKMAALSQQAPGAPPPGLPPGFTPPDLSKGSPIPPPKEP